MVFLSSWCLSFGKIFHYFNLRKESLESVRNVDEEAKERQQPYFHALAQSGFYAYCLVPARHRRKFVVFTLVSPLLDNWHYRYHKITGYEKFYLHFLYLITSICLRIQ